MVGADPWHRAGAAWHRFREVLGVKRDPALVRLSRDHHKALAVALALRRAEDVGAAAARFGEFWREHGNAHFRVEEDVLFPAWTEAGEGYREKLVLRALREHHLIRSDARRVLAGQADLALLRELGERLDAHVRFEERELFAAIERSLSREQLDRLADEVERAEGAARGG